MAMELDAMQACYQRIARGWSEAMPAGQWTSASLFWAEVADIVYAAATAIDLEGRPRSVSLPRDVHEALRELRDGMAEPDRGTWLSASATLTSEGVLELACNWDRRFYWGSHEGFPWAPDPDAEGDVPSDAQLLDDLAVYPREPMFLPAWFPREGEAAPAAGGRLDGFAGRASALPEEARPLMDAWGWPAIAEMARDTATQAIGRVPEELQASLAGERGPEARDAAVAEFREGVVGGVMASLDRGPSLVPVRLWRELAALDGRAEPAGLQEVNDDRPVPAAREHPAMAAILADLEHVVRRIVDADLAARLGA